MFDSSIREDEHGAWVMISMQEMIYGTTIGAMRQYVSAKDGRKPAHGFDKTDQSPLGVHVDGAVAELAVAKVLGKYYDGTLNTFKKADIGTKVQVRHTVKHNYKLIIRPNDDPDHVFILVTGEAPELCVRGWSYGRDVMKDEYKQDPNNRNSPAWFVPQNALRKVVKTSNEQGK